MRDHLYSLKRLAISTAPGGKQDVRDKDCSKQDLDIHYILVCDTGTDSNHWFN